jgi:hypothetical protein
MYYYSLASCFTKKRNFFFRVLSFVHLFCVSGVCVGDNGGKDKLIEWGWAKHRTTDQDLPHPLKASKQASKQAKQS